MTVESREVFSQTCESGILNSGFVHRFAMTAHSPVVQNPAKYGVSCVNSEFAGFADNDRDFIDDSGAHHEKFSDGLKKALFNYMHSICFEYPLNYWFDFKTPATTIGPKRIINAINKKDKTDLNKRLIWIGCDPRINRSEERR